MAQKKRYHKKYSVKEAMKAKKVPTRTIYDLIFNFPSNRRITDTFDIGIGNDHRSGLFVCDTKRVSATLPEPYDNHDISDWIISSFKLKEFKTYRVRVVVEFVKKLSKKESKNDK